MFLSLFNVKFITENLYLVKSTKGKGVFCIFIATTFLVNGEINNILMTAAFAVIGAGFLFVGIMRPELDELGDVSKADVAAKAFEHRGLLNKV